MRQLAALIALLIFLPADIDALGAGAQRPSSTRVPILLDTDIGTDIDDAFALALILNSRELDLLGVTTVAGDTRARARLAAKLLAESGRVEVPVVAGQPGKPQPIDQTRWADGFNSPQLREEKAVDFMRREIERRPGEIILVAIGELTNVAALLNSDPSLGKKMRRIVLMGGSVERGYGSNPRPDAEWNIKSNPAAAQTVFSSGVPILMVPLDVTAMLQRDAPGRRRVFTHLTPLTIALTILYHLWGNETPTLFDPMAVAMLIDPSLCDTRELAITVDFQGFTGVAPGKPPNATVALHTDPARFFQFYLSRVAP